MHDLFDGFFANAEAIPALFLIVAVVATLPLSFYLLRRYRQAIERFMRTSISGLVPNMPRKNPLDSQHFHQDLNIETFKAGYQLKEDDQAAALYRHLSFKPWQSALYLALAGFVFATIATILFFPAEDYPYSTARMMLVWLTMSWPVILTIFIVATPAKRQQVICFGLYIAGLILIGQAQALDFVLFWLAHSVIPTFLAWAILNRKLRAVGPIVISSLFVWFFLTTTFFWVQVFVAYKIGMVIQWDVTFSTMIFFGIIALVLAGWIAFKVPIRFASRYLQRKTNDYILAIDTIWLLFTYWLCMTFFYQPNGGTSFLWFISGLLAFVGYKIVALGCNALLQRESRAHKKYKLLLLRVFGHQKRSEQLLHQLALHWRHVGAMQLIAGTDLAGATVEPHEFLDFINQRIDQQFIKNTHDLKRGLKELDTEVDRDGRYRINEFFCYEDTWKDTLSALIKINDCVLMDLRGFSKQNQGCIYELQQLVNVVPLKLVTFLVDYTTDKEFLRLVLSQALASRDYSSPNGITSLTTIQIYQVSGVVHQDLHTILKMLATQALEPKDVHTV